MPYLTFGDDFDPTHGQPHDCRQCADPDGRPDHAADPHPLAPVAETTSEYLWAEGDVFSHLRRAFDPEAGRAVPTHAGHFGRVIEHCGYVPAVTR